MSRNPGVSEGASTSTADTLGLFAVRSQNVVFRVDHARVLVSWIRARLSQKDFQLTIVDRILRRANGVRAIWTRN